VGVDRDGGRSGRLNAVAVVDNIERDICNLSPFGRASITDEFKFQNMQRDQQTNLKM
jgi:hypothetical protein